MIASCGLTSMHWPQLFSGILNSNGAMGPQKSNPTPHGKAHAFTPKSTKPGLWMLSPRCPGAGDLTEIRLILWLAPSFAKYSPYQRECPLWWPRRLT